MRHQRARLAPRKLAPRSERLAQRGAGAASERTHRISAGMGGRWGGWVPPSGGLPGFRLGDSPAGRCAGKPMPLAYCSCSRGLTRVERGRDAWSPRGPPGLPRASCGWDEWYAGTLRKRTADAQQSVGNCSAIGEQPFCNLLQTSTQLLGNRSAIGEPPISNWTLPIYLISIQLTN